MAGGKVGRPKGLPKTGGRQKGVPNKVTADVRAIFAGIMERNAADVEEWIRIVAATDPAKAADLMLRMAEYHIPKLARSEHTGRDGGPIVIQAGPHDDRI